MKFEYECGNLKSSSSKTVSFLRVVNIADAIKKSVHQLNASGLLVKKSNVPDNVLWILGSSDKYLLLAEFSVRTVNYGLSFFHRFMAQARSAWAINRWKKRGSVFYRTNRKNEANKTLIIWLLPVWGTGNKCRTRDLTVIWQVSKKKVFIGARKQ